MGQYVNKAIQYHSHYNPCSSSVLMAFKDVIGVSEREANRIGSPMGSGMMGTCGAVLAAQYVLKELGREADAQRLSDAFKEKNGSVMCREIRSKRLQSCRGCVIDAATLLEEML